MGCIRRENEERRAAILALRREGLTNPQIAARLNCTVHAVSTLVYKLRESGATVPRTTYPPAAARRYR